MCSLDFSGGEVFFSSERCAILKMLRRLKDKEEERRITVKIFHKLTDEKETDTLLPLYMYKLT